MELTLTNNFYVWARSVLLQAGNSTSATTSSYGIDAANAVSTYGTLKATDANTVSTLYGINGGASLFCFKNDNSSDSSYATTSIWASDGTTAPTINDYNLAHSVPNITGTLSAFVQSQTGFTLSCIVTNIGSSSINIQEIGLLKNAKTTSNGSMKSFLLARGVLDAPVAIPAGESKTFDVTISLPIPS